MMYANSSAAQHPCKRGKPVRITPCKKHLTYIDITGSTPLQIEQPVPQASMSILQLLLAKGWTNESTKILGCCTLLCRLEACRCRVSKWCPCSSRRHWLGWALFYSPQQLLERYPEVCIMLPSSQANNNNTCEVYDFFFFFSFSVSQSVFFFHARPITLPQPSQLVYEAYNCGCHCSDDPDVHPLWDAWGGLGWLELEGLGWIIELNRLD